MFRLYFIKQSKIIKTLSYLLLCLSFYCFTECYSNAIFTREYQKKLSIGAYKQTYKSDIYLLADVGYMVHSWNSTIGTAILGDKQYNLTSVLIPNQFGKLLNGKSSYTIKIGFGFHTEKSNLRHELYFKWYSIISKPISLEGASISITDENGVTKDYNYQNLYGKNAIITGMFSHIYKIMYGLNYDFTNVFKLFKMNWDIYIGGNIGFAIINSGIYAGSQVIQTSNGQDNNGNIQYTTTYKNNNVKNADDAEKASITKNKSIGIAYGLTLGTICNLSQSFAFTISANFDATTRPLLTTNFNKISYTKYSNSHLEYNISISLGLLMKAFELRS